LINRDNIRLFRRGAILINTARGPVLESLDLLLEALNDERLGAVGLDVFPNEPPPTGHPLLHHPKAFITGHVAARSPISQRRILETVVREVRAVLSGTGPNPQNIVNPEVLDPGSARE